MRLLLDEHLSPRIAEALRQAGHDAVAVVDRLDLRGLADDRLIDVAAREGRAFVTLDIADHLRIFAAATRLGIGHPGVILVSARRRQPSRAGIGAVVRALQRLLDGDPSPDAIRGRAVWLPLGDD